MLILFGVHSVTYVTRFTIFFINTAQFNFFSCVLCIYYLSTRNDDITVSWAHLYAGWSPYWLVSASVTYVIFAKKVSFPSIKHTKNILNLYNTPRSDVFLPFSLKKLKKMDSKSGHDVTSGFVPVNPLVSLEIWCVR